MGFFDRIREGLSKTTQQIVDRFDEIVSQSEAPSRKGRPIDVDTIEALEELLIMADVGMPATDRIIAAVKQQTVTGKGLRDAVKDEIRAIFASVAPAPGADSNGHRPHVVLVVGVNGTGKTTTVGKAGPAPQGVRQEAAGRGGRHVSRRGCGAIGDLGDACRRRSDSRARGRRSGSRRIRWDCLWQSQGARSHSRRYRRAPSHEGEPDERAGEDSPRRRARGDRRAARSAARARRHGRPERAEPGARVHERRWRRTASC